MILWFWWIIKQINKKFNSVRITVPTIDYYDGRYRIVTDSTTFFINGQYRCLSYIFLLFSLLLLFLSTSLIHLSLSFFINHLLISFTVTLIFTLIFFAIVYVLFLTTYILSVNTHSKLLWIHLVHFHHLILRYNDILIHRLVELLDVVSFPILLLIQQCNLDLSY